MRHETETQIRRFSDILVLQLLPALRSECVGKLQLFYLLSWVIPPCCSHLWVWSWGLSLPPASGPGGCIGQWHWQCCSCQPRVGSWFLQTVFVYGNRKEDNSSDSISKSYTTLSVKTAKAWSTPERGKFGSERLDGVQGEQALCCLYTITARGMELRSVCPWLHGWRPCPALEKAADSTYPWGREELSVWQQCTSLTWLGMAQGGLPPPQVIPEMSLKLKAAVNAQCYYCLLMWSMCSWWADSFSGIFMTMF